jgi:hypothetical protein
MTIFGVLSGIHLIGLLLGPMGYAVASLEFLNSFFFVIYLATVIVLEQLFSLGLPVFVEFGATWPEPTLLGSVIATLIWFCAYFGIAYAVAFAVAKRGRRD